MRSTSMILSTLFFLLAHSSPSVQAQSLGNGTADSFDPRVALNEGIDLGKRKKLDQARQKFEETLALWQVHPTAALYLRILDDVDNGTLKKKVATDIFKRLKEDHDGKHKKALKEINKAVKKNKSYFPLYLVQADLLARTENEEQISESFAKGVELTGDSPLALLHRGKFYVKNSEYDLAIEDFTIALARDPSSAITYFERGFTYVLKEKYDKAIADFEQAIALYPAWEKSTVVNEAYHNRGVKWIHEKNYRKAIADFEQAIRINPDYLPGYLNRGSAYRNLKQYSKAISDFTFCIEKDATYKDAYYNRAITHFDRGHYQKAADDLTKAVELQPQNKRVRYKLAESYYNLENYKLAVDHFDKVIQLD
ncbi:tetratricopeptide repeat protein, partial [bacterium]|nr:tetratricopeptide repeat protein [bacterium]